ncbi:MAG: hydroxymethylbilane synthase [Rhodobiaceae bacterium]|jgi:hydroxymethylbilane synthase
MTTPSDIFDSRPLILGSRASALALAQADIVRDRLAPLATDILSLTTRGDRILDRSLADAGGKGLFVKELERQLLDGNCDAAVHSMKDMETVFADGTAIAAVLPREDRRDALIGPFGTIDSLPHGAVVGTASVRRRALLHHHRPDLRIELLRGNVNTRLAALAAGRYDAIILAMAGLRRLALDVPHTPLDPVVMPPAAAQGALAIQIRGGDDDRARAVAAAIAGLNCARAEAEVTAERAMLAHLDGSCHTPIAASATFDDNGALHLDGMVLRPDGTAAHRATGAAPPENAAALGRQLGARLLEAAGGRDFLA